MNCVRHFSLKALKAGDTTISVQSSKAYLYNDETLTLAEGSSAVKVAAGDDGSTEITTTAAEGGTPVAGETTNITVSVNGTDYLFSERHLLQQIFRRDIQKQSLHSMVKKENLRRMVQVYVSDIL